ncbi:9311_t:CDS:1, partial [Gigaspora margarita]
DFEPALIHHYYDRDQCQKTNLALKVKESDIYDPSKLTIKSQESSILKNKTNFTIDGAKNCSTPIGHNMPPTIKPSRSESQIGDYLDKLVTFILMMPY